MSEANSLPATNGQREGRAVWRYWRQLKWRIVAAQMVVVLVGVTTVLLLLFLATSYFVPGSVRQRLLELTATATPQIGATDLNLVADALLAAFRSSVSAAVLAGAVMAIAAGIVTGLLLAGEILRPLRQITASSRRIASGHYDERIPLPATDELAQVAMDFNQMAEALAEVEQTRVALIGDVSHELRTPLTGLAGYLEGMQDGLFSANEETLALMYQEVRRMRRLVDDLRMLSQVEAGRFALNLNAFDVCETVRRVVRQLQPQWQTQQLDVGVNHSTKPVYVYADEDRVAQILLNLLGNAIAYTEEGDWIRINIERVEREAIITVRDSGIGIDPQQLHYLFERFFRVDRSRARTSGGSGIGLTISRHLAWAMGGELTVASEGLGQGSAFRLTLPLARQALPAQNEERSTL